MFELRFGKIDAVFKVYLLTADSRWVAFTSGSDLLPFLKIWQNNAENMRRMRILLFIDSGISSILINPLCESLEFLNLHHLVRRELLAIAKKKFF